MAYVCRLCWYVADKMVRDIKAKEEFPSRVLSGLEALATFLINEVRIMERKTSTEAARKDSKDQVPNTIRDPGALAREFRWRVRLASDLDSGDELGTPSLRSSHATNGVNGYGKRTSVTPGAVAGVKRKRGGVSQPSSSERGPQFHGYEPRPWDVSEIRKIQPEQTFRVPMTRPEEKDGIPWLESNAVSDPSSSSSATSNADHTSTIDEVVKIRKATRDGVVTVLERQTIRRVFERWEFVEDDTGEVKVEAEETVEIVGDGTPVESRGDVQGESESVLSTAEQGLVDSHSPRPDEPPGDLDPMDPAAAGMLMDVDETHSSPSKANTPGPEDLHSGMAQEPGS